MIRSHKYQHNFVYILSDLRFIGYKMCTSFGTKRVYSLFFWRTERSIYLMYTRIVAAKLRNHGSATDRWEGGLRALPGSRTVPRTAYWPRERRSFTSHDAMKPPAPVTHTLFPAASIVSFGFWLLSLSRCRWRSELHDGPQFRADEQSWRGGRWHWKKILLRTIEDRIALLTASITRVPYDPRLLCLQRRSHAFRMIQRPQNRTRAGEKTVETTPHF